MSASKKDQRSIQKEEILQAVLIADDYDYLFSDYTKKKCAALLPVVGRPTIDYALEHLGRSGIQETVIFCSSNADEIKKYVANSRWYQTSSPMKVTFIVSERCESLGDAIRDIDNKAIIKGNFVLLNAFSISNVNLLDIIAYHVEKCSKDKKAAMTLVFQDVGCRVPRFAEDIYAINSSNDRLLLLMKGNSNRKLDVPLDCLMTHENISIFSNLMDTGIAICSPSVPILFSDNFDFQTKDDFIRGVLINEEILDSRIYCYEIEDGYGGTFDDWQSYQRISSDIIHRWTFPLVPDQSFSNDEPFYQLRNCIYKQQGVHLTKSVELINDVVIGQGSQFEGPSRILRSVIGKNCSIGKNVDIRDAFIYDNCIINDNCKITLCVIGEGSVIKHSSSLTQCFLKKNVVVNEKSSLVDTALRETTDDGKCKDDRSGGDAFDGDSDDGWDPDKPLVLADPEAEYSDDDFGHSSASESDGSYAPYQEADDNIIFFSEVVESLLRGFEEKFPCENLILEINSSRYAYNVELEDVTKLTAKAIFTIPGKVKSSTKEVLTHFLPLFENYVKKTSEAQMDCLNVMTEMFDQIKSEFVKSVLFLYENDILDEDVIKRWHRKLGGGVVYIKVEPLIKWLDESSEESDE